MVDRVVMTRLSVGISLTTQDENIADIQELHRQCITINLRGSHQWLAGSDLQCRHINQNRVQLSLHTPRIVMGLVMGMEEGL